MRELPSHYCYDSCTMVTLNAHFDGKVIVPDEPLDLKPNQKLRISIEPIEPTRATRTDFSSWVGLANSQHGKLHDPGADEDALWEDGPLSDSTSQ